MTPGQIAEKLTDLLADVDALWCDAAADGDDDLQGQVAAIGDGLLEIKIAIEREVQ